MRERTYLDGVAETGVQQSSNSFTHSESQLFRRETQQVGERDDREKGEDEDDDVVLVSEV